MTDFVPNKTPNLNKVCEQSPVVAQYSQSDTLQAQRVEELKIGLKSKGRKKHPKYSTKKEEKKKKIRQQPVWCPGKRESANIQHKQHRRLSNIRLRKTKRGSRY